MYLKISKY